MSKSGKRCSEKKKKNGNHRCVRMLVVLRNSNSLPFLAFHNFPKFLHGSMSLHVSRSSRFSLSRFLVSPVCDTVCLFSFQISPLQQRFTQIPRSAMVLGLTFVGATLTIFEEYAYQLCCSGETGKQREKREKHKTCILIL